MTSSRARERNEALATLGQIDFSSRSFNAGLDKETVLLLVDSVSRYIVTDKIAFEKTATLQISDRLAKSSAIFNAIVRHCLCRFRLKQKQLEQIVHIIINNFCLANGDLFRPVIVPFAQALADVLSNQYFFDCLHARTQRAVLDVTIKTLGDFVGCETNDENIVCVLLDLIVVSWCPKNTSNLHLLTSNTEYHTSLLKILIAYYKYTFSETKKERGSLVRVFKLINGTLTMMANTDIKICHRAAKLGINFILEIKSITFPNLVREIAIFLNMAPLFLACEQVPRLAGDNWNIGDLGEMLPPSSADLVHESEIEVNGTILASSQSNLEISDSETNDVSLNDSNLKRNALSPNLKLVNLISKAIEVVIDMALSNPTCSTLSVDSVTLFLFPQLENTGWFTNRYMCLNDSNCSVAWLVRTGLVGLITAYYNLKNHNLNALIGDFGIKRRKLINHLSHTDSLESLLSYQSDTLGFLLVMAETRISTHLEAIVFQCLSIHMGQCSSNADISASLESIDYLLNPENYVLDRIVGLFELNTGGHTDWMLLALNLTYSISCDFSISTSPQGNIATSVTKILKYCIEFLKEPKLCRLSSRLLFSIFHSAKSFSNLTLDSSIIQLLENVIELSEISGPSEVSLESNLLWISLLNIGMSYKFKTVMVQSSMGGDSDKQLFSHKLVDWIMAKDFNNIKKTNDILSTCQLIFWLLGKKTLQLKPDLFQFNHIYAGDLVEVDYLFQAQQKLTRCIFLQKLPGKSQKIKADNKQIDINQLSIYVSQEHMDKLGNKLQQFVYNLVDVGFTGRLSKWTLSISIFINKSNIRLFVDFFDKVKRYDHNTVNEFYSVLIDFTSLVNISNFEWISKIVHLLKVPKLLENAYYILNYKQADATKHDNDFESQIVNEFISGADDSVVRDDHDMDVFNPQRYNWTIQFKNLIEQKLFVSLIVVHSTTMDLNNCIKKMMKLKWRREGSQLAVMFQLYSFLDQHGVTDLKVDSVQLIINCLTQLLQDATIMKFELMISVCCKLLSKLCPIWINSRDEDLLSDAQNIFSYFKSLNSKQLLHTDGEIVDFFGLSISILENITPSSAFSKDEILALSGSLFQVMTNSSKFKVSDSIMCLLRYQPIESQLEYYEQYTKSFQNAYSSSENSATFNIYMGHLSSSSDTMLVATISNLIEFSDFQQMKSYFSYFSGSLESDIERLFWNLKPALFKQFVSFGKRLTDFPYDLFGFKSKLEFLLKNNKDLIALALVNNSIDEISEIARTCGMKVENMLKDAVPVVLSFGEAGLNSLQTNYPKFARSMKSTLREQLPLVLYQILIKCNVCSEVELLKTDELQLKDGAKSPYIYSSANIEFLKEYSIFQTPKKCNLLLHSFITQSGAKRWTVPLVFYLCTRILFLIENSILDVEKTLHLRRLKFLYMKCPELFNCEHISTLIIRNILRYLSNDTLRDDVCQMIICLMNFDVSNSEDILVDIWLPLTAELLKCKNRSQLFLDLVEQLEKSLDHPSLRDWAFITGPCVDKLTGKEVELDFSSIVDVIDCKFPFMKMKSIMEILPFLMGKSGDIWDIEKHKNELHTAFIQKLFNIQLTFAECINADAKLWIGMCLGKYYELTGDSPNFEHFEFEKTIFERYSGDNFHVLAGKIDYIFELMIIDLPNASLHSNLCFQSITGVIIEKQRSSLADIAGYISYEELIRPLESFIQTMSNYTCSLSVSDFEVTSLPYYKDNMATALNGFGTTIINLPFQEWITKIVFSIINELSAESSIFTLLATYISQIPSFAIKCFCPLVLYFIQNNKDERNKMISSMVIELFEQDFKLISLESIELFCQLALLIRSGTKSTNKFNAKFVNVYRRLNKPRLFMALEFIGKHKASCLMLEDYYTNSTNIKKDSWKDSQDVKQFMKMVYSGISEPDLMMGLPVDPNLDYGLGIIQNNGAKSSMLMFENGKIETGFKTMHKIPGDSITHLSNDLVSTGWTGVSKIIGENIVSSGQESESVNEDLNYLKLWRLNQWDLPVSDKHNTENKIIYDTLKILSDCGTTQAVSTFNSSIVSIVENLCDMLSNKRTQKDVSLRSWMKSLSIVNNMISISRSEDLVNQQLIYENDTRWVKHSDLETFENLLLSRQIAYGMLSKKNGLKTKVLEVNELHRFNKLMAVRNETQKAINTAVHLDRISKIPKLKDNHQIQQMAKFNLALAFWMEHSETTFPVSTLKLILDDMENSKGTLSKPYITAVLIQWLDESRQETPENIMKRYIEPIAENLSSMSDIVEIGETYRIFAEFCDKQLRSDELSYNIPKVEATLVKLQKDIHTLGKILKSNEGKDKHGLKQLGRLKGIYSSKKKELKRLEEERVNLVKKAINFYLLSISVDHNSDGDSNNVDRFCALWMENNEIPINGEELIQLPTYKFVPWNNQLTSRLLVGGGEFQTTLQRLVTNIAQWHPFQTLYMLKSLRINKMQSKDATVKSRGEVCESIWKQLMRRGELNVEGFGDLLGHIDEICDKMVEICEVAHNDKRPKSIDVRSLKSGRWWIEELPRLGLPSPVMTIAIRASGVYRSSDIVRIEGVERTISIAATGVSAPKIMKIQLSDGSSQRMLLKSPDDLRQDAIMEQVFGKVNRLLAFDPNTRKRRVQIRTYNVLPLGPQNGVIEFVANSKSMMDIMYGLHGVDSITSSRRELGDVEDEGLETKQRVFEEICERLQPKFRYFFFNNFISSDVWFESRMIYTHGLAVSSIIGYVLGIGDRHCNNVLIDKRSGEPIHIDFGVVFDQGKLLPIPERVPFRLTRELVDGLGITGVDGVFSKTSEHVFRVLRGQRQHILDILDVLRYDPLYLWTLSPLRRRKLMQMYGDGAEGDALNEFVKMDSTSEASTAIEGVSMKLGGKGLRDEAVVRDLVREATLSENLAQLFRGWSAFL